MKKKNEIENPILKPFPTKLVGYFMSMLIIVPHINGIG